MKRMVIMIAVLALATAAFAQNDVRISQVYGGGGGSNSLATFNQDFAEIFNAGENPVDISGWTLQYGAATGNWGSSAGAILMFPDGTVIAPCSYLLVACGTVGTNSPNLPYYDFVAPGMNAAQASGKFALFTEINFNLACGAEIPGTLVDKVAFGTANCWEGTAATPALSVSLAAIRNGGGLVDTNDNAMDFTIGTPAPRSSVSPQNADCLAVSTESIDWSTLKSLYR